MPLYASDITFPRSSGTYGLLCSSSWIFFSSAAILFAPLIFEIERTQMEEMHKQQQRQVRGLAAAHTLSVCMQMCLDVHACGYISVNFWGLDFPWM